MSNRIYENSIGGWKIRNQKGLHFITCTVVGWIDVFTRKIYKEIIIDSLRYCRKEKGLKIHAYVIMSNHIHLVISTDNEDGLSSIIRDFKKFTSKSIIKEIIHNKKESRKNWMLRLFQHYASKTSNNKAYQFWKRDNHPVELISEKWVHQKVDYIHLNPVKAGFVDFEEDYAWSSARDYAGRKGMLEVDML